MRTGLLLTKDAGLLDELLLPFKLGLGGPVAGGRNYMPWISLADEVGLMLWALDTDRRRGVYNATRPEPGHQPRVLEGARARAGPPGGAAGPEAGREGCGSAPSSARSRDRRPARGAAARPGRAATTFRLPEIDAAMADTLA